MNPAYTQVIPAAVQTSLPVNEQYSGSTGFMTIDSGVDCLQVDVTSTPEANPYPGSRTPRVTATAQDGNGSQDYGVIVGTVVAGATQVAFPVTVTPKTSVYLPSPMQVNFTLNYGGTGDPEY